MDAAVLNGGIDMLTKISDDFGDRIAGFQEILNGEQANDLSPQMIEELESLISSFHIIQDEAAMPARFAELYKVINKIDNPQVKKKEEQRRRNLQYSWNDSKLDDSVQKEKIKRELADLESRVGKFQSLEESANKLMLGLIRDEAGTTLFPEIRSQLFKDYSKLQGKTTTTKAALESLESFLGQEAQYREALQNLYSYEMQETGNGSCPSFAMRDVDFGPKLNVSEFLKFLTVGQDHDFKNLKHWASIVSELKSKEENLKPEEKKSFNDFTKMLMWLDRVDKGLGDGEIVENVKDNEELRKLLVSFQLDEENISTLDGALAHFDFKDSRMTKLLDKLSKWYLEMDRSGIESEKKLSKLAWFALVLANDFESNIAQYNEREHAIADLGEYCVGQGSERVKGEPATI